MSYRNLLVMLFLFTSFLVFNYAWYSVNQRISQQEAAINLLKEENRQVLDAFERETGKTLTTLKVDRGAYLKSHQKTHELLEAVLEKLK